MAKNSEIKRSVSQSEGPQSSYPGTGPDPNEICDSSDGLYAVQSGRFEDAEDGYGEGQIHGDQEATSADTFPQADSTVLRKRLIGQLPDNDLGY